MRSASPGYDRGMPTGRQLALLLLLTTAACGPDQAGGDASNGPAIDSDPGAPDARQTTTGNVDCDEEYVRTVTAASGARSVSTNTYAIVDGIEPTDDFSITTCGPVWSPPLESCGAGVTCTGASAPDGTPCYTTRGGQFYAGTLTILCSSINQSFDAGGVLTATSGYSYSPITITRF